MAAPSYCESTRGRWGEVCPDCNVCLPAKPKGPPSGKPADNDETRNLKREAGRKRRRVLRESERTAVR